MARIARTDTLRPVTDERPIFIPDGDVLIPQPEAAGPWFPGVQHGGAIAALVARAVEAVPSAVPMVTTRLSVDMSRRVPMGPTRVETAIVRDGLRLQAVECRYVVDGETVGRASAMRVRASAGISEPIELRPGDKPLDPPASFSVYDSPFLDAITGFFKTFEGRQRDGEGESVGDATMWMRATQPFVAGEPNDPRVMIAAVADMMPSGDRGLDYEKYISINSDLVVSLVRPPEGEWLAYRSRVRGEGNGYGQADAALYDERGFVGRALKSLLVDLR